MKNTGCVLGLYRMVLFLNKLAVTCLWKGGGSCFSLALKREFLLGKWLQTYPTLVVMTHDDSSVIAKLYKDRQ